MKHKGKFIVGFLVLALIVVLICYFWIEQNKWTEITYQTDRIEEKQESFDRKPNFDDCFRLVSNYFGIGNYKKVILLGEKCIKLEDESKKGKTLVYFWLASSYHRINDDKKARYFLKEAVSLDTGNFLRDNQWIEKEGMENIFNSLEIK